MVWKWSKEYGKKWYEKNRAKRIAQIGAYQKRQKEKLTKLKLSLGCKLCGYNKCANALEFHHLDATQKEKTLSELRFWSYEKMLKEIEKCVCLCSNCHREVEAGITKLAP